MSKPRNFDTREHRARTQLNKLGGYDFHRMKLYLNSIRNMMKSQSLKIADDYKAQLTRYPQSAQMIHEVFQSKMDDNDTRFVGILLNSSLVASASIFESMFKKICHFTAHVKQKTFNEPRQVVNVKCKEFIMGQGVKLLKIERYWKRIETILQVRHWITHTGSTLPYSEVHKPIEIRAIRHIKSNEYIQVKRVKYKRPKQFLITDQLYVIEFLDLTESYLLWILMELEEIK